MNFTTVAARGCGLEHMTPVSECLYAPISFYMAENFIHQSAQRAITWTIASFIRPAPVEHTEYILAKNTQIPQTATSFRTFYKHARGAA